MLPSHSIIYHLTLILFVSTSDVAIEGERSKDGCTSFESIFDEKVMLWCGGKVPEKFALPRGIQKPYGELYVNGSTVKVEAKNVNIQIKEIAPGGLAVFNKYKQLDLNFPIGQLNSSSFEGLTGVTSLRINAQNIERCAFVQMINLQSLYVKGFLGTVNIHRDVFNGLPNLKTLQLHEVGNIVSRVSRDNETFSCHHFLCALRNLQVLRIGVDPHRKETCQITFSGFPSNATILTYLEDEAQTEFRCGNIDKHDCHYGHSSCGSEMACSGIRPVVAVAGRPWLPWAIAIPLILLILIAIGVGVYVYVEYAKKSPTPTAV